MGYWSNHPMCGDNPLDAKDEIVGLMREMKQSSSEKFSFLAKKFNDEDFISLMSSEDYKTNFSIKECPFALAFLILENKYKVTNPILQQMLFDSLGDGGAKQRCYKKNEKDSPLTYVNILKSDWVNYISGNKKYDLHSPSLLETFYNRTTKGLINTR